MKDFNNNKEIVLRSLLHYFQIKMVYLIVAKSFAPAKVGCLADSSLFAVDRFHYVVQFRLHGMNSLSSVSKST